MEGGDREEQYDPLDILGATLTAKQTVSEKHISFQTLVHIQKSGRSSKKCLLKMAIPASIEEDK